MKKVLVFVALAMLVAAPAMATIAGSKHDLSSASTGNITSNTDETCVFCHTPHGAGNAGFAPLWNRTAGLTITTVYANPAGTMDAVPSLTSVNNSDAVLCLSCHDGSSVANNLNNPPNSLGAQPTVTGTMAASTNIGVDLSNDHPVGFSFATAIATDTELNTKAIIEAVAGMEGALSYGGGDDMWCSSCHDVHGAVAGTPFLRVLNTASGLCTTCHIK